MLNNWLSVHYRLGQSFIAGLEATFLFTRLESLSSLVNKQVWVGS